ncbi:MAG: orotate phosphoribosyltransferase [Promethearchaeota archaeon]
MMEYIQKNLNENFNKKIPFNLNSQFEKEMTWSKEKEILGKLLLEQLYECGAIKTWYRDKPDGWILRSKLWSPIYISLRSISSKNNSALLLYLIGKALSKLIINEVQKFDKILGLATTGIQIATAITMVSNIPSLYTRKLESNNIKNFEILIKKYGEHNLIEGDFNNNDIIVIVDDLVTKLDSVLLGKKQLLYEAKKRKKKIYCNEIVVLIDRQQGADLKAQKENLKLHSLIKFKSNLSWLKNKFKDIEYQIIKEYFEDYTKFQEPQKIKEIISLAK